MKMHYLKILSISLLFLILLAACGGGGGGSSSVSGESSSLVSLTVGGSGQTASLRIEKNTLFAQAKKWINDLIKADDVIAGIPSNVSKITFNISASDMTTITKTDSVSGQSSITETFTVPNGNSRHFAVSAYDSAGTVVYTGSTDTDLSGSAVTLDISMTATTTATYSISGTVADTNGKGLSGATVTLTGATGGTSTVISSQTVPGPRAAILTRMRSSTTTTDASGQFTFTGVASGTYTISVSLSGYSFSPSSSTVTVGNSNITGQLFTGTASPSTHGISGTVTTSTGAKLSGVTMTLSGAASAAATTDANGNYSFSGLKNGNYTITPSLTSYTFAPTNVSVNINGADVAGQNFTASSSGCNNTGSIKITGITPAKGTVLTVNQNYTFNASVQYDFQSATPSSIGISVGNNGNNLDNQVQKGSSVTTSSGTANVSASATMAYQGQSVNSATVNVSLFPQGFNCTYVGDSVTYTVSAASTAYAISGTITSNGSGLSGVTVALTGAGSSSTTTDTSGNYSFTNVSNGNYTITPSLTGYSFNPVSGAVTVSNSNMTQNFTAAIIQVQACNATVVAGGDGDDTKVFNLGKTSGTISFYYDTQSVPDEIVVIYEGKTLYDTGCVGQALNSTISTATVPLTYSGSSSQITVVAHGDCDNPQFSGTYWTYSLSCP
jgi:protocatechuate 3,4-dioxygenase beta subunit